MGPNDAPRKQVQYVVKTDYRTNCLQIYEHLKPCSDTVKILVLADSLALSLRLRASNIFP